MESAWLSTLDYAATALESSADNGDKYAAKQIRDAVATGTQDVPATGVWAIIDNGDGESISMVYPAEIDALRVLNGRGYGRVMFIPWGKDLIDIAH